MSSMALKITACVLMAIDHIGLVFGIEPFRVIGRAGFPIFAFLIADGWARTHDRWTYFLRICLVAVLSQVPYCMMCNYASGYGLGLMPSWFFLIAAGALLVGFFCLSEKKPKPWWVLLIIMAVLPGFSFGFVANGYLVSVLGHQTNVLYTFAVSMCFLYLMDTFKEQTSAKKVLYFMLGALVFIGYAGTCDYSIFGVILVCGIYFMRDRKPWCTMLLMGLWCMMIYYLQDSVPYIISGLFGCSLCWMYDAGKGAAPKKMRRAFYLFYPVHMAALCAIRILVLIL